MGFDPSQLLTASVTVFAAVITGVGAVWVARSKSNVDLQAQVHSGVRDLIDQLQEERDSLTAIIKRQREEMTAGEGVIAELEKLVRAKRRRISVLEDVLLTNGIEPPADAK